MPLKNMGTINKQFWGGIETICVICKQKRTMKNYENGNYTIKCGCGCEILKRRDPDEFHPHEYYTRTYISKKRFKKEFHKKDSFEKNGFKKENGKYVK